MATPEQIIAPEIARDAGVDASVPDAATPPPEMTVERLLAEDLAAFVDGSRGVAFSQEGEHQPRLSCGSQIDLALPALTNVIDDLRVRRQRKQPHTVTCWDQGRYAMCRYLRPRRDLERDVFADVNFVFARGDYGDTVLAAVFLGSVSSWSEMNARLLDEMPTGCPVWTRSYARDDLQRKRWNEPVPGRARVNATRREH